MRTLALLGLLAGALLLVSSTGCNSLGRNEWGYTPAESTSERYDQIARNWDFEGKQTQDDIDHLLLLRPAGHLTLWNVR